MASTPAQIYTQSAVVHEDVSDQLPIIMKGSTPILTKIGMGGKKARANKHEWIVDSISAPSANNAQKDGNDSEPAAATYGARAYNYRQIMWQEFAISDTMGEAGTNMDLALPEDAYLTQKIKKMKQMALDLEYALVNATGNVGAVTGDLALTAETAPEMCGLIMFASAVNNTAAIAAANLSVSGMQNSTGGEGQFKVLLRKLYNAGSRPDFCLMSIENKGLISNWKGKASATDMDAKSNEVDGIVRYYKVDEGILEFMDNTSGMATSGKILVGNSSEIELAWVRKMKIKQLGKHGDNERYLMTQEVTYELASNSAVGVLSLT
jgi:hypothetical protein